MNTEPSRHGFPHCGHDSIGFYPLVPRADWLHRLLPLGTRTIQLRVKDLTGADLEREVEDAAACARRFGARFFVNDHWELALRFRAYGVHLGQNDLPGADLGALARAGIRLGISTMSAPEIAAANRIRPSYIAIGAVFSTPSKPIEYTPLGLDRFRDLARQARVPVVAIGGITIERAAEVCAAGAEGIAVIADVLSAPDPEARARKWLHFFESRPAREGPGVA
jgi:thiamine-phosphate diphosphorylase